MLLVMAILLFALVIYQSVFVDINELVFAFDFVKHQMLFKN